MHLCFKHHIKILALYLCHSLRTQPRALFTIPPYALELARREF
jgi:hypothetical protein